MQRVTQKSLDRQRTIGGELWDDDYSLDLGGIIILPERAMSFPFPWLMTPLIASDSLYMAMVRQTESSYGGRHGNSGQLEAEYFKAYYTRQSPPK